MLKYAWLYNKYILGFNTSCDEGTLFIADIYDREGKFLDGLSVYSDVIESGDEEISENVHNKMPKLDFNEVNNFLTFIKSLSSNPDDFDKSISESVLKIADEFELDKLGLKQ